MNPNMCDSRPLSSGWMMEQPEGCADVVLTRIDGRKITVKDVRADAVSPVNEDGKFRDVIGVEMFYASEVKFFPFIESWEFIYH